MKKFIFIIFPLLILTLGCDLPHYRNGALLDVNETSPTFNKYVLSEDYKGMVSAWYFGHST
jgi:hypothetical protein